MHILFLILGIALLAAAWKTGFFELAMDYAGDSLGRFGYFVRHESGSYADLAERLKYRDFFGDVIETADGWMWAGCEVRPIPTDGFTYADFNALGVRLNGVLCTLEEHTWIQAILRSDSSPLDATTVFDRVGGHCGELSLKEVFYARARHIKDQAKQGNVIRHRLYVFIGRQRKPLTQRVPLLGMITSKPWVDLEARDFLRLHREVIMSRNTFMTGFTSIGGWAKAVPARTAFEIAYERLNPERAMVHPAPVYDAHLSHLLRAASPSPERDIVNKPEELSAEQVVETVLGSRRKARKAPGVRLHESSATEELFAESPREVLAFTPITVVGDHFIIGDRHVMTVCLHRLPQKTFCGLMQALTRQAGLYFDYEVSASFHIGEFLAYDELLERKLRWTNVNLVRSTTNPNQDEQIKREEIMAIRHSVKKGDEKIGEFGITITFSGDSPDELRERRDTILVVLRQMDGMEGVNERAVPLDIFFSGLPCTPHTDFRRRPVLSGNAVGLMPLTGAASGVPEEEATHVFQRADGGLFYWNPRSRLFSSGMSCFVGKTGSGKSGAVNLQRTLLLGTGHRGVTLDFGGSAFRVSQAVGGEYIDVTDPMKTRGLGLFDIRPKPDEHYQPDELTEEGLPLDRLKQVELMLETLCLDPQKPDEVGLPPTLTAFLNESIRRTYHNLIDETPTIDHFIMTLRRSAKADREKGEELAARLTIYAKNGSLGRFLNDQSEPISVENSYTVFDFRGAVNDKHLMLVSSMAVISFISRLLRVGRHVPKFIDVDEFQVVSRNPRICMAIDQAMRTARKLNAHCSVASQDPKDFDVSDITRGVRGNCEVYWLFRLERPQYAREVFEFEPGIVKLLERIQSTASPLYRDCVLKYPGGIAHLRLLLGPLDRRLLLGAGREVAEFNEALDAIQGPVSPHFIDALAVDGLGTTQNLATAR
jgi:hypothetical protein